MAKIHCRDAKGSYLCGVGKRWASQTISSTTSLAFATCRSCYRVDSAKSRRFMRKAAAFLKTNGIDMPTLPDGFQLNRIERRTADRTRDR
jgi:hypothetical protein